MSRLINSAGATDGRQVWGGSNLVARTSFEAVDMVIGGTEDFFAGRPAAKRMPGGR